MSIEVVPPGRKQIAPRIEPSLSGGRDIRIGTGWLGELKDAGNGSFSLRWRTNTIKLDNFTNTFNALSQAILRQSFYEAIRNKFHLTVETPHPRDRKVLTNALDDDAIGDILRHLTTPADTDDVMGTHIEYKLGELGGKRLVSFKAVWTLPAEVSEVTLSVNPGGDMVWSPELIAWLMENNVNRNKFGKFEEIDVEGLCALLEELGTNQ